MVGDGVECRERGRLGGGLIRRLGELGELGGLGGLGELGGLRGLDDSKNIIYILNLS